MADQALIGEMRRYARAESHDEQPVPELDSEAVDFRAASESFASVRKLARRGLLAPGLVCRYQDRPVPTVDRLQQFPDAWIQAGRFAGTDKAEILDHAEFRELPITAIEAAIGFVTRHLSRGAEIGAARLSDRWTLPPVAIREALINAVAHADHTLVVDYANRGRKWAA